MVFRMATHPWSRLFAWRPDRSAQVKVEREPRTGRVKVPPGGVETAGEKVPTTPGENVSCVQVNSHTPERCRACLTSLSPSTGGIPPGSPRRGAPGAGGSGGAGAGRGGGDGSEGVVDRLHDTQLQQQIILALRRLREDMRSVMDRLEVVERLAASHVSRNSRTSDVLI